MPDTTYWQDIKDYAEEIAKEHRDDEDARQEAVHEYVDGSKWIIYNANHEKVLSQTDNYPDSDEVAEMSNPKKGWEHMRMVAAFMAMESDLMQAVNEAVEELPEEEEE
jgi:hypothetical protein